MSPRDSLDDPIDDLYRGPLSEFTSARNALAKTQRGADATRVRKLAKPTVIAWAVNQVYWHARAIFDRLMKSGERLRKTQIAALQGKPADVRAASDEHRAAIADAVREAERLAKDSGAQPSPDALMRTFEALSVAPHPPDPLGRLSEPLQPAGFEALLGITPAAHAPASRAASEGTGGTERKDSGSVRLQPDRDAPRRERDKVPVSAQSARERAREEAAEARRRAEDEKKRKEAERERQAKIKSAEAAVAEARKAEAAARATFERAQRDLRSAEDALDHVRSAS